MTDLETFAAQLRQAAPELELLRREPMSRHTTFRVGGPAALMALPRTLGEAKAVVKTANEAGIQPFFLGSGSNLLVSDEGTNRFVVKLAGDFSQVREIDRQLAAGGGVSLARLANAALDRGLTGLEFAQGIPGSVGGGVFMNAGAYGGELSQAVSQVTALEPDGTTRTLSGADCGFSYRKSVFSDGRALIVEARFVLQPGDRGEIKAKMDDFAARRREKQPLEYPSAGSAFKRPEGHFAAALIDQCGLRGLAVGGARVSDKHAGFIINTGGATCRDILELMDQVRERVLRATGVELEPEVRYLK